MKVDWLAAARDVLLTLLLAFLAVQGLFSLANQTSVIVLGAASFGAISVGFCIAGCLSPRSRFTHLGVVALGVWLLGSVMNAVIRDFPSEAVPSLVGAALVTVAGAVVLGGGVSLAIVPTPLDEGGDGGSGGSSSSSS